jgi:hypothetical protein
MKKYAYAGLQDYVAVTTKNTVLLVATVATSETAACFCSFFTLLIFEPEDRDGKFRRNLPLSPNFTQPRRKDLSAKYYVLSGYKYSENVEKFEIIRKDSNKLNFSIEGNWSILNCRNICSLCLIYFVFLHDV